MPNFKTSSCRVLLFSNFFCNFFFIGSFINENFLCTALASKSANDHLTYSSESSEPSTTLITKKYSTLSMVSI